MNNSLILCFAYLGASVYPDDFILVLNVKGWLSVAELFLDPAGGHSLPFFGGVVSFVFGTSSDLSGELTRRGVLEYLD